MRERVEMAGGEFTSGRRPDGGWAVAARLPLHPGADGLIADQAEMAV
jgi:hypothetical protein